MCTSFRQFAEAIMRFLISVQCTAQAHLLKAKNSRFSVRRQEIIAARERYWAAAEPPATI
jgi:hypothetical protein